jgi:hypothetical protein
MSKRSTTAPQHFDATIVRDNTNIRYTLYKQPSVKEQTRSLLIFKWMGPVYTYSLINQSINQSHKVARRIGSMPI